jgi:hypothetical protein
MDLRKALERWPAPFIKGFLVLQSTERLDVTAVYSAAGLDESGRVTSVTSIDVEKVKGSGKEPPGGGCPDLVVRDIGPPAVSCPQGSGSCVTQVEMTVANIGGADAGPFRVKVVLDPRQSVTIPFAVTGGLQAGKQITFSVTSPPGGNCFDPDCTITVTVDSDAQIPECNEQNNQLSETTIG